MAEPDDKAGEVALWRRWHEAAGAVETIRGFAPDALMLAAYAEDRLDEAARDRVEDWLASHPEALADIVAARGAAEPGGAVPDAVLARAMGLVFEADPQVTPGVVPFRRPLPPARGWRRAAAWSGIAASLLATSLIGFALGNDAYMSLQGGPTASALAPEVLDPPGGIFTTVSEDQNT
jgi:anti-sigma factor RsiW